MEDITSGYFFKMGGRIKPLKLIFRKKIFIFDFFLGCNAVYSYYIQSGEVPIDSLRINYEYRKVEGSRWGLGIIVGGTFSFFKRFEVEHGLQIPIYLESRKYISKYGRKFEPGFGFPLMYIVKYTFGKKRN